MRITFITNRSLGFSQSIFNRGIRRGIQERRCRYQPIRASLFILYRINTDIDLSLFLCRLRSIGEHRDHFVRCLSVRPSVCLSGSHTFLVVRQRYVLQATHAFLGMLPPCFLLQPVFLALTVNISSF